MTDDGKQYRDADALRKLYHEERKSLREIADELDCHATTVNYWMKKHGIQRRTELQDRVPKLETNHNGYEVCRTLTEDKYARVRIHRLLAVAKYGFDTVADNDVHHENGIPWDNRPDNISVLPHEEHVRLHSTKHKDNVQTEVDSYV